MCVCVKEYVCSVNEIPICCRTNFWIIIFVCEIICGWMLHTANWCHGNNHSVSYPWDSIIFLFCASFNGSCQINFIPLILIPSHYLYSQPTTCSLCAVHTKMQTEWKWKESEKKNLISDRSRLGNVVNYSDFFLPHFSFSASC